MIISASRRTALGLIGAAITLPRAALAAGVETLTGDAFGTNWRIAAPEGSDLAALRPAIDALFGDIDTRFSPWRTDSEISRFNAAPAGTMPAHAELARVASAALDLARRSEGAFDPTVGPLVAQWGFGPIGGGGAPDWRGIGAGAGELAKSRAGLTLDLCGIAKGWALDRAAALARDAGIGDMLFELGGEVIALGRHPEGRDWRVAVEAPRPGRPPVAALRLPPGAAVATSGTRDQSYVLNGRLYSHIIDPAARAPAAGRLRAVTVAGDSAMTADGWATALLAAGDAAGPDLAASEGIAALFLYDEDGEARQVRTGPISELIL